MTVSGEGQAGLRLDTSGGRWVLAATVLGSSLAMLTGTVVNIALPAIGAALDAGTAGLQWVLNGYLLAVASLMLIGGSLGDRFGRRRVFVIGCAAFAVTTLLCGLAPTIEILIGLRVTQGVAAALLTPGSLAIIEAVFHPDDRGRAIGAWSALGGVGAAVGPVLGGWLVDVGSWRWVFFLGIPLAIAVVVIAVRWVPESRDPDAGPLDWMGASTIFLALACVTWALILAPERGVTNAAVLAPAGAGVAFVALFVLLELRQRSPMLPLDVFENRQFSAANAITLVIYAALGGVFFLLVVHLQVAVGYSALEAGAALLPVTVLMLVLSSPAGAYAQRHGARLPLSVGGALIATGMLLMARIQPGGSYVATVLPAVGVFGLGLAATVAPVTTAALAAAGHRSGLASGINNAVSRTAQLAAVAIVPWAAGLHGDRINDPAALAERFPLAMVMLAAVALSGAVLAWGTMGAGPLVRPAPARPGERPARPTSYRHCAVDASPLRVLPERNR